MSDFVWQPPPEVVERANVTRLAQAHGITSYQDLLARSREDIEWFWDAVVTDLGVEFGAPYERVLDTSQGVPWAKWFVGGELNIANNCVDRHRARDDPALAWEGEEGATRAISYRELAAEVDRVAAGLVALGISRGDRVGLFLPMIPEAVIAFMACCKIGAIIVPVFSGFAGSAAGVRLADAQAKALICADAFHRRGAIVSMKQAADEAAAEAPSVEHIVVVRRVGQDVPMTTPRDVFWDELGSSTLTRTERMGAEDPFLIAYTSGTTGRPKGAVHVHGGFLVKIAAEVAYQTDYQPGDVLFWLTDPGWIMGPWEIVGTLALGGTILLYDGAPNHPGPDRLWSMIERHGVNIFGVSPTLVRALAPAGDEHVTAHDLSSLRILGSTGETWNTEPYLWFHERVGGGRCPIINFSGGTEVGACFLSPTPVVPLKPCSLGGPALGMAVDVFGPDGSPIRDPGNVGELVCTKPWPGMTRGIWGDPDRYTETYWSRWPDVWVHGDWASVDADGQWFLHGRSDDTLNVAGKRVGPAEVESVLVSHDDIVEAAVVGVPDDVKGESIWCFVVTTPGAEPTEALREALSDLVADELGKAFRPGAVRFVGELPKTRNAKVLRRAVRAIAIGKDPGDLSNLENPSALEEIARGS